MKGLKSKKRNFNRKFSLAKEDSYERLKLTLTAAFMPRIISGYMNTNTDNKKDRIFVEKVLDMNTDNLIILKNSHISLLIEDASYNLPRDQSLVIENILKALYLSKIICSLEENVGKIRKFKMQEFDVYIEFEEKDARKAIEKLFFIQNYFARGKQMVKLFSLNMGEYSQQVHDKQQSLYDNWNTGYMIHKIKSILNRDSANDSSDSRVRDPLKDHDENLIYLTTKLYEGLGNKDKLIKEMGKAILSDLTNVIQNFTTFFYLNELVFEDILNYNETVIEYSSINRNLKADKNMKRVTMITTAIRENSMKKYFARGITRLPLYNSIYEIFTMIFDENSRLIISSDWVGDLGIDENEFKDLISSKMIINEGFQIHLKKTENQHLLKLDNALPQQNLIQKTDYILHLDIRWLEDLSSFIGLNWNKVQFFYDRIKNKNPFSLNIKAELLIEQLDTLLLITKSSYLEHQKKSSNEPLQDKTEVKSESNRFPLFKLLSKNVFSKYQVPEIIYKLSFLEEINKKMDEKIMSLDGKIEGSQSLLNKGTIYDMKSLFSKDDINRIQTLSDLITRNLENFNLLTNWEIFYSELLDLLRKPRFPNFYNDRWVKPFLDYFQKKLQNKQRNLKTEMLRNLDDESIMKDLGFEKDENLEISTCSIKSHQKHLGDWNFWSLNHFTSVSPLK
jgi:hypothetical protein